MPIASPAARVSIALISLAALPGFSVQRAATAPGFAVPDGFVVELVAGPPLIDRPIAADFDEHGRLYVAESSGSNDPVERQLELRPHRVVRLEDHDGDGRFDRRVVFADRMMLPQGVMWLDGSLYVGAPPSIWKLTDADGDGVAERREEWFAGKTLTGCANDLHGPYRAPDGMIYWTKGAFAEQTYDRPGRQPLVTRAAHIFRRRPGTALVEPIIAGGMDNPVDVAFTRSGDAIFTATFLEHPQAGRRDALVHAVYGGLYGKPHGVIEDHARTGDLMPPICHYGPAAPSGLTSYTSTAFGEEYRGSFFAALFNMRKVTRHVLAPDGATFRSTDSDFLVADSLDFHPTDVVEDADGSLLVIDTGGWYKLCCPTSQLAKPDVLGGIYRVRREGATAVADPRGQRIAWATLPVDALVALLADPRPFVQRRAVEHLGRRGADAVGPLAAAAGSGAPTARLNAIWALARIDAPAARAGVRAALADTSPAVRRAALHAAGLWRDADAVPALLAALRSGTAAIRRGAAEALGRAGDPGAVPALLRASALPLDRAGAHAVTYALIEISAAGPTRAGLAAASPRTRRAALQALEQMPHGGVAFDDVAPWLDSPERETADTAWWIAGRHPEWGARLAGYFERVAPGRARGKRGEALRARLTALSAVPAIEALLGTWLADEAGQLRGLALEVMAASRVKTLPGSWVGPLAGAVGGTDPRLARRAVEVARLTGGSAPTLDAALLRVAGDPSADTGQRLDALGALGTRLPLLDDGQFALVIGSLGADRPAAERMAAAAVVEHARFSEPQLHALAGVLRDSGPLEVPRLLPAFDHGRSEPLGLALLDALGQSSGRSNIRADQLRPRLAHYPASVQARGEQLLSSILADAAGDAARLDRLVAGLRGGDVRRGQAVFNSARAACAACHTMGYRGGTLGPDLTAIGQVRSERDLLEAIVFPNASFVRGYEPVVVTTAGGAVLRGVLKDQRADEIVLALGEARDERVARSQIADLQPGDASVMPTGYGDQLSPQELADLIAFLKGARWGAQ